MSVRIVIALIDLDRGDRADHPALDVRLVLLAAAVPVVAVSVALKVSSRSRWVEDRVHLLVVDLPALGIHKAIWDEFEEEDFELPPDQPLVLAAYDAGPPRVAYVEPIAVGDVLPDMPLFLKPEFYVPAPLEATYQTTWNVFPNVLKRLLETPDLKPHPRP